VLRRVAGVCGIISQSVGLISLLATVFMSPWFSWTGNHLSVLGVKSSATTLFNLGLILTGVLSLYLLSAWEKPAITLIAGTIGGGQPCFGFSGTFCHGRIPPYHGSAAQLGFSSVFPIYFLGYFPHRSQDNNHLAKDMESAESHGSYSHSCLSASSVAMEWWGHPTVALCFAMVVVDNSLWG